MKSPEFLALIILCIFWLILIILWIRVLLWDIKLQRINAKLYRELSQEQEEIQRLRANSLPFLHIEHQPDSCISHKSADTTKEENGQTSI